MLLRTKVLAHALGGKTTQKLNTDAICTMVMKLVVILIMDIQDLIPIQASLIRKDSIVSSVGTTKFG